MVFMIGRILVKMLDGILSVNHNMTRYKATNNQADQADTRATDNLIAVPFIKTSYPSRYISISRDIYSGYLKNHG